MTTNDALAAAWFLCNIPLSLEKDLNNENYFYDYDSLIVEFDNKSIFTANVDKGKQIRTCSGYYFLFGNDVNFNGFYIRDDTCALPNLYKKTEFFNMQANSKAGFEFDNSNIDKLNVYWIKFTAELKWDLDFHCYFFLFA